MQVSSSPHQKTGSAASIIVCYAHQASCEEDDGVHQAHNPLVRAGVAVDSELFWKGQVGPVRPSLIPALGCSSNGTEDDGVPQHPGAVPFVCPLIGKRIAFFV